MMNNFTNREELTPLSVSSPYKTKAMEIKSTKCLTLYVFHEEYNRYGKGILTSENLDVQMEAGDKKYVVPLLNKKDLLKDSSKKLAKKLDTYVRRMKEKAPDAPNLPDLVTKWENAKANIKNPEWQDATLVGKAGSVKIGNLSRYDNDNYAYIRLVWDSQHKDDNKIYRAISKEDLRSKKLEIDLMHGIYLFTEKL